MCGYISRAEPYSLLGGVLHVYLAAAVSIRFGGYGKAHVSALSNSLCSVPMFMPVFHRAVSTGITP